MKKILEKRIKALKKRINTERWEWIGEEYKIEAQQKLKELERLYELLYGIF
jgi:hypothetical protein